MYATIITPFNIAFQQNSSTTTWLIIDSLVDAGFLADLLMEFFTAYYDEDDILVVDRKVYLEPENCIQIPQILVCNRFRFNCTN